MYCLLCIVSGYIANGKSTRLAKATGLWGTIPLLVGIGIIVYSVINQQWDIILGTVVGFLALFKVGAAIKQSINSRNNDRHYLIGTSKKNIPEMPDYMVTQISSSELGRCISRITELATEIERFDKYNQEKLRMTKDVMGYLGTDKDAGLQYYQLLFEAMKGIPSIHSVLEKYNATPELLQKLEHIIRNLQYPLMRGYYIPFWLIANGVSLNFLLEYKDILLSQRTDEIKPIINDAIRLLYAHPQG